MNDPKTRNAQKKENEEKEALRIALLYLNSLVEAGLINDSHSIIIEALSVDPSNANYNTIKIVLQLQNDGDGGKLRAYVNQLDANKQITTVTAETTEAILAVAPTISFQATESFAVAPHQPQSTNLSSPLRNFGILSPKNRENLKMAGTIAGLSIGPAIFLGTGIAAFVLSAKATATVAAVVGCAAVAGTGFPPLGIAMLSLAGAALLAGLIILGGLALYNHLNHTSSASNPILKATLAATLSTSH